MDAANRELTPINEVLHFSRLHEWIALEEGYFQDEGLEPNMLTDVMHSVSSHHGDEYGQRPQDLPFAREEEVAHSQAELGTACNAGAGMGRVVPDLYSVGRYAIFVGPDFTIERLYELRDVPVGIRQMAGSHFTTLKTLGEVLPKEQDVAWICTSLRMPHIKGIFSLPRSVLHGFAFAVASECCQESVA
jgi:hypothetical protein